MPLAAIDFLPGLAFWTKARFEPPDHRQKFSRGTSRSTLQNILLSQRWSIYFFLTHLSVRIRECLPHQPVTTVQSPWDLRLLRPCSSGTRAHTVIQMRMFVGIANFTTPAHITSVVNHQQSGYATKSAVIAASTSEFQRHQMLVARKRQRRLQHWMISSKSSARP